MKLNKLSIFNSFLVVSPCSAECVHAIRTSETAREIVSHSLPICRVSGEVRISLHILSQVPESVIFAAVTVHHEIVESYHNIVYCFLSIGTRADKAEFFVYYLYNLKEHVFFHSNLLQYQKNSAFSALPINKGFFTPLLLRFYSAETLKNSARLFGPVRMLTDQRATESI